MTTVVNNKGDYNAAFFAKKDSVIRSKFLA